METRKSITVRLDGKKLDAVIRQIEGDNYKGIKISQFILHRDVSYYSKIIRNGVCNAEDFKTLCAYYELNEEDFIFNEPENNSNETTAKVKPIAPSSDKNVELLVVGLNKMYELEMNNQKLLNDLLTEIRATNVKMNRLENALGQIVSNSIEIKTTVSNDSGTIRDIKSGVAVTSGRLKDLLGKFKE